MISSKVLQALEKVPEADRYVIALSGGLDSALLLKSFHLAFPTSSLFAIHVHHGLSPNADEWALQCQSLCDELSVPCLIRKVEVIAAGEGVEAAARKARYQVFDEELCSGDILLQGHHQNDQAETVLIRAFRGSGVKGLTAIPTERVLKSGARIYRPWLKLTRDELEVQADRLNLTWVEDESNADDVYDRNYIRHKVLPVIEERWPGAVSSLAQVAEKAVDTQCFIDGWCFEKFEDGLLRPGFDGSKVLEISRLEVFSEIEKKLLLRAWIDSLSFPQPPQRIFARILTELIPAKADSNPVLQWGGFELRRYDGAVYCSKKISLEQPIKINKRFEGIGKTCSLELLGRKVSCTYQLFESELGTSNRALSLLVPGEGFDLTVKSRSGGESIKLSANRSTLDLKRLFQEAKVPPWIRDSFPLFYVNEDLAAVGDRWIHADYLPKEGMPALTIVYE